MSAATDFEHPYLPRGACYWWSAGCFVMSSAAARSSGVNLRSIQNFDADEALGRIEIQVDHSTHFSGVARVHPATRGSTSDWR